ncbi:MAG TPA: Mth938-like domain-containing protein [Azospirillaceae bacterium]|nr:Mth938-like domain-containing protein [Azospirillaceae bacterium]
MDVTPIIPADRKVIDSYGPGLFRVSGTVYRHAMIVFPGDVMAWAAPAAFAQLAADHFGPVLDRKDEVEVLLLGSGPRMQLLPRVLRQTLRDGGIVVDVMDTGAACRTYNVLLSEGRKVAAALFPT